MNTSIYLSLGQAAKEVGKSKATLSKALKSGKLSYVSKSSEGYKIDPAELFRVFPDSVSSKPIKTVVTERLETPQETLKNSMLERENKLLREQLDKAEAEKEKLLTIVERQTLMLEDKRQREDEKLSSDRWLTWVLGGLTIIISTIAGMTIYFLQSGQ